MSSDNRANVWDLNNTMSELMRVFFHSPLTIKKATARPFAKYMIYFARAVFSGAARAFVTTGFKSGKSTQNGF